MSNNYLENINNACSDHEKALEIYHDHLEAKRVQLEAVEKLYEKPLDILNKEVDKKLKAKHEVVAEAVSNTPQWYKDELPPPTSRLRWGFLASSLNLTVITSLFQDRWSQQRV